MILNKIWAFIHAFHSIFFSEKEKKDAVAIVNAKLTFTLNIVS